MGLDNIRAENIRCDVAVGIIYTNEDHFIYDLIKSIPPVCSGVKAKVVLVDNDSEHFIEGYQEILKGVDVQAVKNPSKYHYSKNINVILQNSVGSKYCLVMNTDMKFVEGDPCVAKMVQFMDSNPSCGLATCRLIGADGQFMSPARRFQSPRIILARRFPFFFGNDKVVKDYLYADHPPTDSFVCDWVSGCFMMVRMQACKEIGFFDEGFVKYFEDVDYCRRMAEGNWQVMYHGAATCIHYEQRASKKIFSKDAYLHLLSYFRFLLKSL